MRRERGFTLIELMIVIAIIAIIAAIAIPGLLAAQRAANERSASASLKTIATAEVDFRSNDRDGNRVNDFWTANVWGLYSIQTGDGAGNLQPTGKYVDMSLAAADNYNAVAIDFVDPSATPAWEYHVLPATKPPVGPKSGYWYYALTTDMSSGAADLYQVATDGGAAIHHGGAFGFAAYPDTFGSGRSMFYINEGATILRLSLNGSVRVPGTFPPNADPAVQGTWTAAYDKFMEWPADADLVKFGRTD